MKTKVKKQNWKRPILVSFGILFCVVVGTITIEVLHIQQFLKSSPSIDLYDRSNKSIISLERQPVLLKDIRSDVNPIINEFVGNHSANSIANVIYGAKDDGIITDIRKSIATSYLTIFYDKDEQMEIYLNELYFGNGMIGLDTASNYYFQKPVNKIDIIELVYLFALEKRYRQQIDETNDQFDPYMSQLINGLYEKQAMKLLDYKRKKLLF